MENIQYSLSGQQAIDSAIDKNSRIDKGLRLVKLYSVKTGMCSEDCSFCGQSRLVKKEDRIVKAFSSEQDIYQAIGKSRDNLAKEILFVSSGARISDRAELVTLAKGIARSRDEGLEVGLDLGLTNHDSLSYLYDAGAQIYMNAVQTARSLFPKVVTSHRYDDKIKVLEDAKRIGYHTRSGGILGLGEKEGQRYEFAIQLQDLPCDSVSLSLFQPIKGSAMENCTKLSSSEALGALALMRLNIDKPLYLLGGREKVLSSEHIGDALRMVNGTTVGDYLFTKGESIHELQQFIPNLGGPR